MDVFCVESETSAVVYEIGTVVAWCPEEQACDGD